MESTTDTATNLGTQYRPIAQYLSDSDSIEYVRQDVPSIHRRVDEFLTLVLDMKTREPIGFRIKGFRSFYLKEMKPTREVTEGDFLAAVSVLERAMHLVGEKMFGERVAAYKTARDMALEDRVKLTDLPEAA